MERATIEDAKRIFKNNFIGIDELNSVAKVIGIQIPVHNPDIPYNLDTLSKYKDDYILILGTSKLRTGEDLNLLSLRNTFGLIEQSDQPCFYNQDWYLEEDFMKETLLNKWYLVRKNVIDETRSKQPAEILNNNITFPSAILCAYTFFIYYFVNNIVLWSDDFIWCSNIDHNNDRIYVGKYYNSLNNNGFSIHRHLSLRNCYGALSVL